MYALQKLTGRLQTALELRVVAAVAVLFELYFVYRVVTGYLEKQPALEADLWPDSVALLERSDLQKLNGMLLTALELRLDGAIVVLLLYFVFQVVTGHLEKQTALETDKQDDFVALLGLFAQSELAGELQIELQQSFDAVFAVQFEVYLVDQKAIEYVDVLEADQQTDFEVLLEVFAEQESVGMLQTGLELRFDAVPFQCHCVYQEMFGYLDQHQSELEADLWIDLTVVQRKGIAVLALVWGFEVLILPVLEHA